MRAMQERGAVKRVKFMGAETRTWSQRWKKITFAFGRWWLENVKRGWREQTNQGGEVNRVKLSEVRELGKNGRWYI